MSGLRIGCGEDTHRLVPDRKLILGGVEIPFELGLLGHSDADVLTHAVIDALLGAAGLPDIGEQFPDRDPQYAGISSLTLLKKAYSFVWDAGFALVNLDVVVTAQAPQLSPYKARMIHNLQTALSQSYGINVKATTPEHCGPEGNLECITARCVCLLERRTI